VRSAPIALLVAGLGIATAALSLTAAQHAPAYSFAGTSVSGRVALVGTGLASVAAGLASWVRRPGSSFGPLLAAAGFAWFLLEWNSPGITSSLGFTAGLVLYAACPPFVAHAALVYPGSRLHSRMERIAVATAYGGTLLVLGLLPTLFFDPVAECGDCARNLILVRGGNRAADGLTTAGLWLGVVWAFALALLVALKGARASAAARRSGRLVVAAAAALYLGLVGATYAASLPHGLLWNGELERRLWLAQAVALSVLVVGVAWSWAHARRSRSAVAQLVVELAQSPPPAGLRDALAEIVGDPTLELAYPLEGSDRLVDRQGRQIVLSAAKQRTSLIGDGRVLAVAAHAPGLLDDDDLVGEVASAARLALENERLQAEVHARLQELRGSRARIVEAGDAERRRLERDLHDGAQQHLVGLSLSLRLARSQLRADADPQLEATLAEADADLRAAVEGLRELAHGIFPAVLADGGLGAAVGALAEDTRYPIRVEGLSRERYAPVVESAAYMLVAETAAAATGALAVRAERRESTLVLEIEAQDTGARLGAGLEDRIGAADGRLTLERSNGRVRIVAELPCRS
jgi:signal transduction histidine kinase